LDHLDRRQAALPEAAALVEGWVVLDGLESGRICSGLTVTRMLASCRSDIEEPA
jgi:hypothetical protein